MTARSGPNTLGTCDWHPQIPPHRKQRTVEPCVNWKPIEGTETPEILAIEGRALNRLPSAPNWTVSERLAVHIAVDQTIANLSLINPTYENFCGCCGHPIPDDGSDDEPVWCHACLTHIGSEGAPWDRTYEATTGTPCPWQVA